MKSDQFLCLAFVILFAGLAHAGSTVYKCNTAQGVTFQDTPCSTAAQTVAAKDYYNPQPANAGVDQNGNAWRQNLQSPEAAAQQAERDVSVTEQINAAGYVCEGGGKSWVSKSPCSATTKVGHSGVFSGSDQFGNHVTGTTTGVANEAVQQTAMSRDELCQKLREHPPTSDSKKKSEAESAYDRNKLHNESGC